MGPQGSGKGTQASMLQTKLTEISQAPVVDIQTGQLFRSLAARGSYAGARVGELINSGDLVPDHFTNAMWIADMTERVTADCHLLLDGFPRTLEQAMVVDEMLRFFARSNVQIIYLDTPEDIVIERMLSRGREDDTPNSIKHRLDQYKSDTVPVLEYYRCQSDTKVHMIDGAQSMTQVQTAILTALDLDI